jgi:hypothetical protein
MGLLSVLSGLDTPLRFASALTITGIALLISLTAEWLISRKRKSQSPDRRLSALMLLLSIALPWAASGIAEHQKLPYPEKTVEKEKPKPFMKNQICDLNLVEFLNFAAGEWDASQPGYQVYGWRPTITNLGTDRFRMIGYYFPTSLDQKKTGPILYMYTLSPQDGVFTKDIPIHFAPDVDSLALVAKSTYRMTGRLRLNPACTPEARKNRSQPPGYLFVEAIQPVELGGYTVIEKWSVIPPFNPVAPITK